MEVRCASCAGKIALERDEPFLRCPFCGSTLYLDRAQTFQRFLIPPAVPRARVDLLLREALAEAEMPPQPVQSVAPELLPFWSVQEEGGRRTIAAFSPQPPALHGFSLPSAGAVYFSEEAASGFAVLPCAESASAQWRGREASGRFSLVMVPFYRLTYGADKTYSAWIDGVTGKVHLGEGPPPQTTQISRRFWAVLTLLFLVFTAEAFLLRGIWSLAVVAGSAAAVYPAARRFFQEGGP